MTALRQGQLYRFGTADTAYVIAPLIVHEKMAPWAVLVSIPHSTVMAVLITWFGSRLAVRAAGFYC